MCLSATLTALLIAFVSFGQSATTSTIAKPTTTTTGTGSCYFVSITPLAYYLAQGACNVFHNYEGHLAFMEDGSAIDQMFSNGLLTSGTYWLGISQDTVQGEPAGGWNYEDADFRNRGPINSSIWCPDQPDNSWFGAENYGMLWIQKSTVDVCIADETSGTESLAICQYRAYVDSSTSTHPQTKQTTTTKATTKLPTTTTVSTTTITTASITATTAASTTTTTAASTTTTTKASTTTTAKSIDTEATTSRASTPKTPTICVIVFCTLVYRAFQ